MEMHKTGMSPKDIGRHPDIQKDRSTIIYHLRSAGLQPNFIIRPQPIIVIPAPRPPRIPIDIVFGPGRCKECGIILAEMPTHNCEVGAYYKREMWGNGTGEEMV